MNLTQMRGRLRKRIGNPSVTNVPDVDLTAYLNFAYLDIADRFRFHRARQRCRFNTIAGVSRYGTPPDSKSIFRLQNVTQGYKLRRRWDEYLADTQPTTNLTTLDTTNIAPSDTWGPPTEYLRYRDYMDLMPIPDGVYTIEVYYKLDNADLVDDDDEPVLPRVWHVGIVMLATWYYYDEEKDLPKATVALNSFSAWASTKPNEIDEESMAEETHGEVPTLASSDRGLDFSHSD